MVLTNRRVSVCEMDKSFGKFWLFDSFFFKIWARPLASSANRPIMSNMCSVRTATCSQTWCTASLPTCWLPSSMRSCRSRETAVCSSKVPPAALWPSYLSATLALGAAASSTQETRARTVSVSFASCEFPADLDALQVSSRKSVWFQSVRQISSRQVKFALARLGQSSLRRWLLPTDWSKKPNYSVWRLRSSLMVVQYY